MPKILYVATEDWFFVSHFMPVAQVARECGFEIAVATRVGADAKRLATDGFRIVPLEIERGALNPLQAMLYFLRAARIVRAERPDIVHCISLRPAVIGGLAARLAGTRALVVGITGLGHLWLDRGLVTRALRATTRVALASWLRGPQTHYLFENHDDPREFGFDPSGFNITIVGGAGVDPAKVPRTAEPPSPPVKVAVVSRMIEFKGIAEAVEAVRRARAAGAAIELHLFGDPDPANLRSIPRAKLLQWAAQPGITWHGSVSDIVQVWRDHHIAMLLSYREGLPRALVEAAASGRPIVTTNVPGCREVVRDGVEGILVPPYDADSASRALIALAGDSGLRARMGAAAHARFRERFTAEVVKQTVRNLYRSLEPTFHGDR